MEHGTLYPLGGALKTTRCPDCLAPIVWAKAPSGKAIPVNNLPSQNGTLLLLWEAEAGLTVLHALGSDPRPRYLSHLATCAAAKARRDARKSADQRDPPAS